MEATDMRGIDLTGMRFGKWTVIGRSVGPAPQKWLCRCDCGTEKSVLGGNLRYGKSTSCGCVSAQKLVAHIAVAHPRPEVIGARFGRWMVLNEEPKSSYRCRC